jgi:hypothetical protein
MREYYSKFIGNSTSNVTEDKYPKKENGRYLYDGLKNLLAEIFFYLLSDSVANS